MESEGDGIGKKMGVFARAVFRGPSTVQAWLTRRGRQFATSSSTV
jgi:hypothetical protein